VTRSQRERLLASWWILLTLVPLGITAWVALVYAGVRAKRRLWIAFGLLYFACLVAGFWLIDEDRDAGTRDDVALALWFVAWAAPFGHALAIRRRFLELTEQPLPELARAEARAAERAKGRSLAAADPVRALELGVGRPDLDHAFDAELVDLNNAPRAVLERLPGVDAALAERIVAVREEVEGFSSVEDFGHVLGLDADTIDRLRRDVVVLPRGVERI
jgi:DNA uptake protein ComE-like DNA-binding protein